MNFAIFCFAWAISKKSGSITDFNPPKLERLAQVGNDWQMQPFTHISGKSEYKCRDSEENVFVRKWRGTELGCNFPEIDPLVGVYTPPDVRTYAAWLDDRNGRKECRPSERVQPIPKK